VWTIILRICTSRTTASCGNGSIRALTAEGQQKWIGPPLHRTQFPILIAADDQGGSLFYLVIQNTPGPFDTYCYYGRVDQNGRNVAISGIEFQDDYAIHPDEPSFWVEPDFQNTPTTP